MDGHQFDSLIRRLTTQESRRGLLGGLIGSVVGLAGAGLTGAELAEAKKGGKGKGRGRGKGKGGGKRKNGKKGKGREKVLICHKGQEIMVARPAVDAHVRNHGDTVGPCPPPNACAGRNQNDPCTLGDGSTGACCGGNCTPLNTLQNCQRCGDVCEPSTDTCSGLGSGDDPNSGCCAAIYSVCDPDPAVPDRCCNQSTCSGTLNGQTVCCGISGSSPCSTGDQCCSGVCDLTEGECA